MTYWITIAPMVDPQENEVGYDVVVRLPRRWIRTTRLREVIDLWQPGGPVFKAVAAKGWIDESGNVLRPFRFSGSDSFTAEGFRTELRWTADS